MEEPDLKQPNLIGRENELSELKQFLERGIAGNGSTMFVAGEAGIGKTQLVEEFRKHAEAQGVRILSGAAMSGSAHPFQIFSKALVGVSTEPLFEEQEYTSFTEIFAVNSAGMLLGKASSEEGGLDADIFAGMLSAVQDFVRDSFGGGEKTGLGRLEYGDMKILIEHGQHLFLTAVFSGTEHPDMKNTVKQALKRIEESHGQLIERWTGRMSEIAPVQEDITKLASTRFLVRKNLEGVKLENERIRIADRVLETMVELSGEIPLLILLEDMQWTDESSLFVLNYLARNIRNNPILLLGTFRPGESSILQRAVENMMDEEIVDVIALGKLDAEHTVSLINDTFAPNDFPDTLAKKLFEQSRGNPLFVVEMLRGMHDDGSIAEWGGRYTLVSDSYQVPATVEEVVNRRLEMLDPDSMAMLEYVSCIGQRFDASMAASNRMVKDSEASLQKLAASGIISVRDGSAEFSHAVFQSVIYNGIGERWRNGHHKSLGEYLEITFSDRLDYVMYELARHFSRTHQHAKTHLYCTMAGEKAERSFAMEQALGHYSGALAALSKLGDAHSREGVFGLLERIGDMHVIMGNYEASIENYLRAKEASDEIECMARMLRKTGEAYEAMGEYEKTMKNLEEAKSLMGQAKTPESGRLLRAEGVVHYRKGDYDAGLGLFRYALSLFEEVGAGHREMGETLRLIGNIHGDRGEYGPALEHYEESLAMMEEDGYRHGIAAALSDIGGVLRHRGEDDRALECHERSLEIREEIGDKLGIARSLNNIGVIHWQKGRFDQALASFGRSLDMLDRMGDKHRVAISLNNIGGVHQNKGELDRALEIYERSLAIKESIGDRSGVASSITSIGGIWHTLGELDKALEFLQRSLVIREEMGDRTGTAISLNNIGEVHHYKGLDEEARIFLERSLAICQEVGEKWLSVHNHCVLAEVCTSLNNLQEALGHAESALAISSEIEAKSEEGMSRRNLGAVWRWMKEPEKAATELERAECILEEIENREELAKLSYERALLHREIGEKAKARKCLEMALVEFGRMGMKLWEQRCRAAIEKL